MRKPAASSLLFLSSVLLVIAGQYGIIRNEPRLGRLPALLPPAIAAGLGLLLCGALVAALVVGRPATPDDSPLTPRALSCDPQRRRRGYLWCVLAGASAVVTAALLTLGVNGRVAAWLVALAAGLAAARVFDRIRGTAFVYPVVSRREWIGLTFLSAASLLLVVHDNTHWRWSGTPDESFFFMLARDIAQGRTYPFLLSQHGVFDFQPVLSSYYQALFMKLFGINVFGWRLSSAVALAVAVPLEYLVARELWNQRVGWFAAVLFGCAHLAVGFAHFGYNNTQVYPLVTGSLAALLCCTRQRSLTGYYLTGWIAGLGFFTYYVALVVVPLVVLLGWSSKRLSLRHGRRIEVVALAVPILLCALPALTTPLETAAHAQQLSLGDEPTFSAATGTSLFAENGPAARIGLHWLLSVAHGWYFHEPHHFQPHPIVDPVSGALAAVGFWLAAAGTVRRARDGFLVPGYLIAAFVAGAITPHYRPPLTRLLVLAPLTALLSAVGLEQVLRFVGADSARRSLARGLGAALLLAAISWNILALHRSVYRTHRGYGDGTTSELLRLAQQVPANYRIVYVQRPDTHMVNVDSVLAAYNLDTRFAYLRPDEDGMQVLAMLTPPFLVAYDLVDPDQMEAVERALTTDHVPAACWRDSALGKKWNLRYCTVPDNTLLR